MEKQHRVLFRWEQHVAEQRAAGASAVAGSAASPALHALLVRSMSHAAHLVVQSIPGIRQKSSFTSSWPEYHNGALFVRTRASECHGNACAMLPDQSSAPVEVLSSLQ